MLVAAAVLGSMLVVDQPAQAAPQGPAVLPRDLPALAMPEAAGVPAQDPATEATFAPLGERNPDGSSFDPARSEATERTEFTTTYANPDGTQSYRQSTTPLNVQDEDGDWQPIDVDLEAERSGRVEADAHPLSPSFAPAADGAGLLQVEVGGDSVSLGFENAARGRKVEVDGATATYEDVAPATDLEYEVTPGSVKETIVLDRAPKPGKNSWRFTLATDGLTPRLAEDGSVELVDGDGGVPVMLPPIETWDSAGGGTEPPALTGGTYGLQQTGNKWVLTVTVDEAWLQAPERVYPVSVDPTFTYTAMDTRAYRSNGYTCTNCGVKIGNSMAGTAANPDTYNRTAVKFDYSALWGKNVVNAQVDVARINPTTFQKAWEATIHHATALNYNGVGQLLGTGVVGDVGRLTGPALTQFVRDRVNARDPNAYYMLVGTEQSRVGTYKNLTATMTVDVGSAAPAPVMTAPANDAVLTSLTPTLSVNPVTDPDGEPVSYCFRIATGADGKTGAVVDSGCRPSTSWTVPEGVLADGVAYTWLASAYSGTTMVTNPAVGRFKIDQRIGNRGPAPVDFLGPVQVNLANGNVTTSASSPTFTTVGGSAGLNLTYNSQQPQQGGLTASYFDDPSHAGLINDNFQKPVLVRNEPQINADWGTSSPFPPILGGDWWLGRWQGFFVPPVTGTYQFAGVHDDVATVEINGAYVYDVRSPSSLNWANAKNVDLIAGQMVPITVELQELTGAAQLKLFTRTTAGGVVPEQIIPTSWLTTADSPALPKGWTLSADLDGSGATYTEATMADQTVVLTDASGAKHTWTKTAGGYAPPTGEDGVLAIDSSGRITVTEGGQVYAFRTDGKLDSLTSVLDSRKPAALQNVYSGTPSRLTQIKDPVSGRAHTLTYNRPGENCYGGANVPAGFDAAAPGRMLCRVTYWDGTETRYWYAQGRLARIEDPGGELTDYAYDASGLLTGVRDSLGADWVAANPAANAAADATTTIGYTTHRGKPAAQVVAGPKPSATQERPQRSYRYDAATRTTFVDVAGLTPAGGFASKVVVDDADRLLSATDATGRTKSQTWNVKDMPLTSTDAAGRVSTTVYDDRDRPVATYGPAPASCFTGQTPTSACAATVPQTRTGYDEGLVGLWAAFYDNTTLTGAPKVHQTGLGGTDGRLRAVWNGTDAPAAGIPAASFSVRATGEITFPAAGTYTLELEVDDGARLWIDDTLIVDSWVSGSPRLVSGGYANAVAGSTHRIRVDYFNGAGPGSLNLNWRRPDGASEPVPGANLKPGYGLTTSSTQAESAGVPDKTTTTRYTDNGLDAGYGLATSTTIGGLVTSGTKFEPPGSGYLRSTAKVMPSGAQVTYTPYGDAEQRDNPCTTAADPANQGGLPKLSTLVTPASGEPRTDEQVYDASGRVVARASSGGWECTTYDDRDRVVTQTFPANGDTPERVVRTTHAVDGNPLISSVSDSAGTITTEVDLLGRVVRYTDAVGVTTLTSYDRAGRVTAERLVPPNSADAPQQTAYTNDDAGRLLTVALDGAALATVTYTGAGEVASVAYGNGSGLAAVGRDAAGALTSQAWRTADGRDVVSAVTRTRAGTVVDESLAGADARPGAPNFVYDPVGRLTEAWVPGRQYSYDFTSPADAACPAGSRANAGANTNRMRMVEVTAAGSAETRYCYDDADRLLATLGATAISDVRYDAEGSTTSYTQGSATTTLSWDGAGRNTGLKVTGADPAAVTYLRDATDRIIRRTTTGGDTIDEVRYGYSAGGDTADLALNGAGRLLTRSIALPGGVLHTWTTDSAARTFDHPTVRGDLSLTTDAAGLQKGELRIWGPYGEALSADGDGLPDNQPGNMDHGWLGQHQRPIEHAGALAIVQMGARPYSPLLGRFLSVDPVDGGGFNDYEYVGANPINIVDLDGQSWLSRAWGRVKKAANRAVSFVNRHKTAIQVVAFGACMFATVGGCLMIGVGVAAATNFSPRRGRLPSFNARAAGVDVLFAGLGAGIGRGAQAIGRATGRKLPWIPRLAGGGAQAFAFNGMADGWKRDIPQRRRGR
ncbi:hypothetical protein DQ237_07985 [Blastococcus sp. TF02-8]|nr:hypothetical protein DQ237_07985 [Blastococcus sp. TF02-8]